MWNVPGIVRRRLGPGHAAVEGPVDLDRAGVQLERRHRPDGPRGQVLGVHESAVEVGGRDIGEHRAPGAEMLAVGRAYADRPAVRRP